MKNNIYNKIVQEYLYYQKEERDLVKERERISAKIDVIHSLLIDLNDALSTCGEHIYEHFVENKPQPESEVNNNADCD